MAKSKSLTASEDKKINKIKLDIFKRIAAAGSKGITVNTAIEIFKEAYDSAIRIAGTAGKTSLITSQVPIKIFHELIKQELIKNKINQSLIFPKLGTSRGEKRLYGYFKDKDQDITIFPNNAKTTPQKLFTGLLHGQIDPLGMSLTESIITINVRSQMSSIANNIDTMYERIFAEPINLHMRCPKIVMGEFYIIPTTGYDSAQVKLKRPTFLPKKTAKRSAKNKTTAEVIEEYILAFQSVNNRTSEIDEYYKYERVCLLIVDFTKTPHKIYQTNRQLLRDNLIPKKTIAKLDDLSFKSFVTDLLKIYTTRFGAGKFI